MTITSTGAPALVLLNGITREADSWTPFREAFPDRVALACDGIAAGPAPTLSIPEQARRVLARMDAEGVGAADVIGFSHGGLVAQQLAIAAPDRVQRLILLATSCGVGATAPVVPWVPEPGVGSRQAQDLTAVAGQLVAVSVWSSIPFLGGIVAPTLILHGRRDPLVPVENARVLARRIPGAVLVELDCGHDLQRHDRIPQVAGLIEAFLAGNPI